MPDFYTTTRAHRGAKPGVSPLVSSGTKRRIQGDWVPLEVCRKSSAHSKNSPCPVYPGMGSFCISVSEMGVFFQLLIDSGLDLNKSFQVFQRKLGKRLQNGVIAFAVEFFVELIDLLSQGR